VKELEALQLELRDCQRRQAEQEEAELALMEQQEGVDAELSEIDARCTALGAELGKLRAAIAAVEKDIDGELVRIEAERTGVGARVEEGLLKSYERLRVAPTLRGEAVAAIAKGSCAGCRTTLPIAFVSNLPEAGATVFCPRCGRILVV
jgi:predicted  nucleic acid-binding Zn-ribbon protein